MQDRQARSPRPLSLRKRLRFAWRVARSKVQFQRTWTVLPDDLHLVSYPKSGNTWIRFLVAALESGGDVDFTLIGERIPATNVPDDKLLTLPRPRALKTHQPFDPRIRRCVYIARDPRDVSVSFYHYALRTWKNLADLSIDDFTRLYIAGEVLPDLGTWKQHVAGWVSARQGDDDFLFLRYEDLKEAPLPQVRKLADFLGLERSDVELEAAIERCSFDRMQAKERDNVGTGINQARGDTSIPFIRSGKTGQWRQDLSPDSARAIEEAFRPAMELVGYA